MRRLIQRFANVASDAQALSAPVADGRLHWGGGAWRESASAVDAAIGASGRRWRSEVLQRSIRCLIRSPFCRFGG